MLCSECGGHLAIKGETIDGQTVFECVDCTARYVQTFRRIGVEASVPEEPMSPEVRSAILEEVVVHVYAGDIDYQLRDYRGETYICPYCNTIIADGGKDPNGESVYCSECQEERSWTDIGRFSTISYLFHRFGIQYREVFEEDIRLGRDLRYNLPPVPPEAIEAASVIATSVLSNASWSLAKNVYGRLKDRMSTDSRNRDSAAHTEPMGIPEISYKNKIEELLEIIASDECQEYFTWWGFSILANAYVAAQQDRSIEEHEARKLAKALSQILGREITPEEAKKMPAELVDEMIENDVEMGTYDRNTQAVGDLDSEHIFSDREDITEVQMEMMDGELASERPSALELTSVAEVMAVEPSYVELLESEFQELTRTEIVSKITDDFVRSLTALTSTSELES